MNIPKVAKILITGANGLVGSALIEELRKQGYESLYPLTRRDCDLTSLSDTKSIFMTIRPDVVFHNAAAVYGIGGNCKNRAKVFLDNILINTHVIEASHLCGAKKVVAMGTVAAYPNPKMEPVEEHQIWDGPPHGSESSYGHAKRAMLAQLLAYQENYGLDFCYAISTNLYGQNDKFDPRSGHVIPSLIRKFHEAKQKDEDVVIWGDGTAARDFLYSKDMARALVLVMNGFSGPINIATGKKCMIRDVVEVLTDFYEMKGRVRWDAEMPNGRNFYQVDLTHLRSLGFESCYSMKKGLVETLEWFNLTCEQNLSIR